MSLPGGMSVWRARILAYLLRAPQIAEPVGSDAEAQPELLHLIAEVAGRLQLSPPTRVLVHGNCILRGVPWRGATVLVVGLPLLLCLPEAELRALVAHRLALLDCSRPALAARLRNLRRETKAGSDRRGPLAERMNWRKRAAMAEPAAMVAEIDRRADEAAVRVSGERVAARALALADSAETEFALFVLEIQDQIQKARCGLVQDLHAGWSAALENAAVPIEYRMRDPRGLARRHPGLADQITGLSDDDLVLGSPERRVPLRPWTVAEQRALAGQAYLAFPWRKVLTQARRGWISFDQVPDGVWKRAVQEDAEAVISGVTQLLGRVPRGVGEVLDVLVNRLADYVSSVCHDDQVRQGDLDPVYPLVTVAESTLLRRGWRRVHPAVSGILVAPDGKRWNLQVLARRIAADPRVLAELQRLVS